MSQNLLWSNIPGLSTLELQFEPRKRFEDSSSITVEAPALAQMRQELLCPICLDVMDNVMVAKCLHRYCKDCIDKHLRQVDQKRECPMCRVHLATNRSLRKDDAMNAIVNLLYSRIDKKRHRSGDNFRPEVSVVRDGAKRHREQVSMMREKSRIKKLSMEASQRIKGLQESLLRRDQRAGQLLFPISSIIPKNNTPLPLPLPSANATSTASNTTQIATNDSIAAADVKGRPTENLNDETIEETSTAMDADKRSDEKIEWAEMKTAEELQIKYE